MPDFTDKYNTELSLAEEKEFKSWLKKEGRSKDLAEYDMRGWWKNNGEQADNGHFPDTYKKPNHPTFSDESIYHGVEGYRGGSWTSDENGNDVFQAGPSNVMFHGPEGIQQYLQFADPSVRLVMP